jgi:hypothetical protein
VTPAAIVLCSDVMPVIENPAQAIYNGMDAYVWVRQMK